MTAKIARGGPARGRGSARSSRAVSTRRTRKRSAMLEEFGLAPGAGRRIGGWIVAGMAVAVVVAAILAFRLPQLAALAVGEGIGKAGFAVRHVEIRGNRRVPTLDVLNVAFDQPSTAMPLVDLEATRQRLLRFGWIKEARVLRRLPDTLLIEVVERQPAAIWQHEGRLSLVDAEGVVLEPVRVEAMPDLPLVIGAGANRQLGTLEALLRDVPHLRPQVAGASWVGRRRWDVRFQTGEVLALPEGASAAGRALLNFARMDQQTQLLGRGFARFDMRIPGRFIVRVSREPGTSIPALAPPDAGRPAQDLSRTI